jgi:hypothetical protein
MGSKTKTPTGGDQTKKKTPGEQIRDNFLQFTSGRPNVESRGMTIVYPDGPDLDRTAGINFGFDPFMSKLLAEARSGRNNPPPSQTMPPVMFEGPPSQTMPPVFIPPQAPPSELFKDSVLNTLETVQLPPSVRDKAEKIPLPGIDVRAMPGPGDFPPPIGLQSPPPPSGRNLLPFMVPLPVGIGTLFREFLEGLQEDD